MVFRIEVTRAVMRERGHRP